MAEINSWDRKTLCYLLEISKLYPSIDAALSKISSLQAALTLPKGSIHVISDIHGEYKKLKHIVNNASGSLRPLVDSLFGDTLLEKERIKLLSLIYYPREAYSSIQSQLANRDLKREFLRWILPLQTRLMRELSKSYLFESIEKVFPSNYREMFREIIFLPLAGRDEAYLDTIIEEFLNQRKELDLLRMMSRVIRNLLISELIVAGDLGDRGSRIDKVIDFIMHQPNVSITWGNHDASWLGACLGDMTCIATVLRISLRYRRLSQLEEGYGIPVAPLEKLARDVYGEDPAKLFYCKGEGLRDPLLMARMQKAIAIIQFKLEGQLIKRNPQFNLEHRNLLHRINPKTASVEIDGKQYPMLDMNLPTIDWSDPYRLSPEEQTCVDRLRNSFIESPILWEHMRYVARQGSMYLIRDNHLIFHACVPVDNQGEFLAMQVDGTEYKGRLLFDALERVLHRAVRHQDQPDLDILWYLWGGPRSPWFGKDKMTTFEGYFIEDTETHHESKNPYFTLIHEKDFCRKILNEFGITSNEGLIVNGHVPVKIEHGESPLKKSGLALTIDGAFSEAYGDKGYTLVLEANRTFIAQHHHFESVTDAITSGSDIVPSVQEIRKFTEPRLVRETEKGSEIAEYISLLELLIQAYRENLIREVM